MTNWDLGFGHLLVIEGWSLDQSMRRVVPRDIADQLFHFWMWLVALEQFVHPNPNRPKRDDEHRRIRSDHLHLPEENLPSHALRDHPRRRRSDRALADRNRDDLGRQCAWRGVNELHHEHAAH